jgi:hypothetical protein
VTNPSSNLPSKVPRMAFSVKISKWIPNKIGSK